MEAASFFIPFNSFIVKVFEYRYDVREAKAESIEKKRERLGSVSPFLIAVYLISETT